MQEVSRGSAGGDEVNGDVAGVSRCSSGAGIAETNPDCVENYMTGQRFAEVVSRANAPGSGNSLP